MKAPSENLYLRKEHIARDQSQILVKPYGGPLSQTDYKVTYEAGGPLFTISGCRYNQDRKCREVRDASGLPMFDIHRKLSMGFFSWIVTMPDSKPSEAIIGKATSGGFGESGLMTFWFKSGEEEHTLSLQKHGHVMTFFDVFDISNGWRIGEIRESARHSQKLALRRSSHGKIRPAWDIILMPGLDMALMAALSVIVSEWHFKTD